MLLSVTSRALLLAGAFAYSVCAQSSAQSTCPGYESYSMFRHKPFSKGKYKLPYMRPDPSCRTFNSTAVEKTLRRMKQVIKDPDLYRLFENSFPNSLDTAVKWRGYSADNAEEELTFLITGDINAMWLRDSANQMQSYVSLVEASDDPDSLAALYRGVINLQARYLLLSPFCNSFQPPEESGLPTTDNSGGDIVTPSYDVYKVWECKYELDSLAAFLEISTNYYEATKDVEFFRKFNWVSAVNATLQVVNKMRTPTYAADDTVNRSPYKFRRPGIYGDSLINSGAGSPVQRGTGLIRSAFRPSDDPTIFQFLIPSNMMFSRYLRSAEAIMRKIPGQSVLAQKMLMMAGELEKAITTHAIFNDPAHGKVYAYEVDGFGSANMMDDANIPSLLSAPFFGYLNVSDPLYQNTRKKVFSRDNPYYSMGSALDAIGGPHDGPGRAWPMSKIVSIFTTDDEAEIMDALQQLLSSTDGLGLMHESILSTDSGIWTRQWFSWANGLFGQMILDLEKRKPEILQKSFQ